MIDKKMNEQQENLKELKLDFIMAFIWFLIGFGIYPIFLKSGIIDIVPFKIVEAITYVLMILHFGLVGKLLINKLNIYQTEKQRLRYSHFTKVLLQKFLFNESEINVIEKDVEIVNKILVSGDNAYMPTYQIAIHERDYEQLVNTMIKIGMLPPNINEHIGE